MRAILYLHRTASAGLAGIRDRGWSSLLVTGRRTPQLRSKQICKYTHTHGRTHTHTHTHTGKEIGTQRSTQERKKKEKEK